jgi:hypothetical protein
VENISEIAKGDFLKLIFYYNKPSMSLVVVFWSGAPVMLGI